MEIRIIFAVQMLVSSSEATNLRFYLSCLYLTSSRQPLPLARKCKVDPPVSFTVAWNTRYTSQTHKSCSNASVKNLLELSFFQARCIADVRADLGHTSFLAGTLSLKEENEVIFCKIQILISSYLLSVYSWFDCEQVHLIRLSPFGNEIVCEGLFYHQNEIWDLKSCPYDSRILSTVYTSGEFN
jgi:hypothetical protein